MSPNHLLLYNFPHSTCSQKVRLVLHEKGLDFDNFFIDHKTREQTSDWYLQLNPNGVVPTLKHGDAIIIDSSVIIEYLDEVFPQNSLTPDDPVARAQMRKWMRYFEEVPTAAIRVPSFNKYLSKKLGALSDEDYLALANKHPVRKHFYLKMQKGQGFDAVETEYSIDKLLQAIVRIESGLEKSGGPWLLGERLSLADYCVTPIFDRMDDLGLSYIWENHTGFFDWFAGIRSRPAFGQTYFTNTRLSEIF